MHWIQLWTGLDRSLGEMLDLVSSSILCLLMPSFMRNSAGFQLRRRTGRSQWCLMLTIMRTSRWHIHSWGSENEKLKVSPGCHNNARFWYFILGCLKNPLPLFVFENPHASLLPSNPPNSLSPSGWNQWRIPAGSSRGKPSQLWLSSRGSCNFLAWCVVDLIFHQRSVIHLFNNCHRYRSNIFHFRLVEVWDHREPRTVMIACEMVHQAPLEPESYTTIEETQANMLLLTKGPVKVTSNTIKKPKTQLNLLTLRLYWPV